MAGEDRSSTVLWARASPHAPSARMGRARVANANTSWPWETKTETPFGTLLLLREQREMEDKRGVMVYVHVLRVAHAHSWRYAVRGTRGWGAVGGPAHTRLVCTFCHTHVGWVRGVQSCSSHARACARACARSLSLCLSLSRSSPSSYFVPTCSGGRCCRTFDETWSQIVVNGEFEAGKAQHPAFVVRARALRGGFAMFARRRVVSSCPVLAHPSACARSLPPQPCVCGRRRSKRRGAPSSSHDTNGLAGSGGASIIRGCWCASPC